VKIVIYMLAGLFVVMAFGLMFAYYRTRRIGLALMGLAYGAAAVLALALMHWWPLAAGFVFAWALKLLGLEQNVESEKDAGMRTGDGEKRDK
jgi:hypothetical protein